ncbi:hypothetical protein Poli38472_006067 [Pythium oligandrum]|uniref:Globin domain-containing protein n=1 Tax=Pythium oligandrum TaxID=41045 RepID=A0A8K1CSU4_PYTOL|nr:hypothetical protein Poli38472_006067 [Pythium oligandrum]|eukprot:TMW68599.1 hypothetical protein Poli38472_006067 [Pythium oligandrum]
MGTCASSAVVGVFPHVGRSKQLTREQILMIDTHLPDFRYYEVSTEEHRQVAASHWNAVFKEVPSSRSTRTESTGGSKSSSATQSGSRIGILYDTFYAYLDKHLPEIKPVFRSSMHVRGKVLVHISAGMRSILASDNLIDKITALTRTHVRFGVQMEHFNAVGNALLYAMRETSEGSWSPVIEEAWRRLFAHCSALLLAHQKKANEERRQTKDMENIFTAYAQGPLANDLYSSPSNLPIPEK